MFEFSITKEALLAPLLTAAGAIDKKNVVPILSHFLIHVSQSSLSVTATDLEIEISSQTSCLSSQAEGSITIPAKKFIDIIRSLDEQSNPTIVCDKAIVTIKHDRSSFKLSTLPAEHFPQSNDERNDIELTLPRIALLNLFQATHFAMAQQDVRVYLNGLLIEFDSNCISAVATDGHRLAVTRYSCSNTVLTKLLLPKKGVHELVRLLSSIEDEHVVVAVGSTQFKISTNSFIFSSKLIEARFPPYNKAIPRNLDKKIRVDCVLLKKALTRIMILANEKSRAVMLHLLENSITLMAHNTDHEEAVEIVPAETEGESIKIGLNAGYLLDVLNHFNEGVVQFSLSNEESSILVESPSFNDYQYVIMPMKI